MFTETEIQEAIEESQEAQRWNLGPRVEITDVEGMWGHRVMFGQGYTRGYPRTQILFKDKLSKKHQIYVNAACNVGHMYNICGIGRIMNQKDCGFDTAARAYWKENYV